MGTKMKGIFQGFKYSLSQMFVVKEPEIEIGNPTDVKHVAHIGWDGPSGGAPNWMNEFKTVPNFSAMTSISNCRPSISSWPASPSDYEQYTQQKSGGEILTDIPSTEISKIRKKQKRKKPKSTSSPKAKSSSSTSRVAKSKTKFAEDHTIPTNTEVI